MVTEKAFPLITVGITVLNREWIIGRMLASLQSQTYPHNKIFVLIVDSESKDKTVETTRKILEASDFKGYDIVVQKCSIPEGRNLCIENMRGDLLLLWDSDTIMEPTAMSKLFETMEKEQADIVATKRTRMSVKAVDEIDGKLNEAKTAFHPEEPHEVVWAGMGSTLISKNVVNTVTFDPDLTIWEDGDFSLRAREKNFKIMSDGKIAVFDIDMAKKSHSDIYVDMPLQDAMKGLRKKSKTEVLLYKYATPYQGTKKFFLQNKRYALYIGYIPALALSILGICLQNLIIALIFPAYLLLFALWQFKKRGLNKGTKALARSLLVGVPNALFIAYYFAKASPTKKQHS